MIPKQLYHRPVLNSPVDLALGDLLIKYTISLFLLSILKRHALTVGLSGFVCTRCQTPFGAVSYERGKFYILWRLLIRPVNFVQYPPGFVKIRNAFSYPLIRFSRAPRSKTRFVTADVYLTKGLALDNVIVGLARTALDKGAPTLEELYLLMFSSILEGQSVTI
jgi:hypothetical protein